MMRRSGNTSRPLPAYPKKALYLRRLSVMTKAFIVIPPSGALAAEACRPHGLHVRNETDAPKPAGLAVSTSSRMIEPALRDRREKGRAKREKLIRGHQRG